MKPYAKSNEILEQVRALVLERRRNGELVLPGVRDLAAQFESSCGTMVKVLARLREEELIYQEKKTTRILPVRRQRLRYGFVFTGHRENGSCWFHAYDRLRYRLEKLAMEARIEIGFFLYDPEDPAGSPEKFVSTLRDLDVIFVSLVTHRLVEPLVATGKRIVILDSDNCCSSADVMRINLDNREVGRMAGRLLLKAGCRQALVLGAKASPRAGMFRLRLDGFSEVWNRKGGNYEIALSREENMFEALGILRNRLDEAVAAGCDSIFFISDEWLDLIVEELFRRRLVPGRISIVAVDGANTAIRHQPPVTTISHANVQIAAEMMKLIARLERDPDDFPAGETVLAAPSLYRGQTLRSAVVSASELEHFSVVE